MSSRIENILQNAIDGSTADKIVPPESRVEYQLQQILSGGGIGGGKVPIVILGNGEFNTLTGVPTIVGASEDTFYLVPDGDGDNLYSEWIYHNGRWENFGYGGSAQAIQSDWNQNDSTAADYIKHKPTIPAAQVQANWSQTDPTAPDYIKNKPSTASGVGF